MAEIRLQVVTEPERLGCTVRQTCERWEITRATFYRWKRRLERWGERGLEDLSRQPFDSPQRIDAGLEHEICRMRKEHPRWGARTIRNHLRRRGIHPPAISTIHRALRRNHLVADQPRKAPKRVRRFEREVPNDLWQMDALAVKLTTGAWAQVLNVLDDCARYLLASLASPSPTGEAAWEAFSQAAGRYGLPRQVLTDNHLSFTGRRYRIVVEFERRLRSAGPVMINGRPAHPETQGKIERFHRTLREWLYDHGPARSLGHLQELLDAFRCDYNDERPNQALPDDCTPAERYLPSSQLFGGEPPTAEHPTYPADAQVRTVGTTGAVTYRKKVIGIGVRWAGRRVRIVEVAGQTQVYFGDLLVRSLVIDPARRYQPIPDPKLVGRRPSLVQV